MSRLLRQRTVGQILPQEVLAAHSACAGAAAAVGRGEGLVQVHVDAVKAHIAGAHHAHDGVEVGAVVVAQAACLVDEAGDLQDVLIKDTHGVGVGQHQTGGILAQGGPEGVQIHAAVRAGGDVHHVVAAHGGGGGVGAVGAVGDDDLGALVVAAGVMILLDEQHTGELTVGAGGGLERHVVHAGDLAEILRRGVQHLLHTVQILRRRQGVYVGKAGQRRHLLVNAGIVLHGAGAEGVEAAVHAVYLLAKLGIVAGDIRFAHLRQEGLRLAPQGRGQGDTLHIAGGQNGAAASGNALFKDQLHFASTSFTTETALSSCSLETFSVAHHRMPSPPRGRPPRISACANAARTFSRSGRRVTNSWKKSPV